MPLRPQRKGTEDHIDALQLFLSRHQPLHTTLEDRLFGDLSEDQARQRPNEQVNPIAWIVWHAARAEDFVINRIITQGRQVLDEPEWPARLNISRRDVATGMNDDEVTEFSANVNVPPLRAYCAAVGQRARAVVQALAPEALDAPIDAANAQSAFGEKGNVTEAGSWVGRIFDGRRTGDVLMQIALLHVATHVGEANVTRALLGYRSR